MTVTCRVFTVYWLVTILPSVYSDQFAFKLTTNVGYSLFTDWLQSYQVYTLASVPSSWLQMSGIHCLLTGYNLTKCILSPVSLQADYKCRVFTVYWLVTILPSVYSDQCAFKLTTNVGYSTKSFPLRLSAMDFAVSSW